jgi:hypothetical protein
MVNVDTRTTSSYDESEGVCVFNSGFITMCDYYRGCLDSGFDTMY